MENLTDRPLRHLCVTHSPLVTRVFEAAMRSQDVPGNEVAVMARRGVSLPEGGWKVDDLSDGMDEAFKSGDRGGFRDLRERLDGMLRSIGDFEAYVPHLNKILYHEVVTHPGCVGYSFLEEGSTSMAWRGRLNARTSWSKVMRSRLRAWWVGARYRFTRPMFDVSLPGYRSAFAISRLAFEGMPGRKDVSAFIPALPAGEPPGKTYLVLDAIHLLPGVGWREYEDGLVETLLGTTLPKGEMLVKFHFAETDAREKFESIDRRLEGAGFPPLRMLGPDFTIEENLKSGDTIVFAVTTLGYYSALAGVRTVCFIGGVKGLSVDALIASSRLPADFPQVVGLGG